MRILFFSHYFPPEGNAPASRTYENTRRWVAAGHDVTVITCAPNCPEGVVYEGYKNRIRQREVMDGIEVIRVWTYVAANKGTVRRILNYLSYMFTATFFSLFIRKPDIVIATSPQFFCGWAGVIYHFLTRVPFVLEIRDIWPESILAVSAMRRGLLIRVLEWLELRMYESPNHIVTVGDGYRGRLVQKGVSAQDVSVVMNGVNRELFFPRDPDPRLKRLWGVEGKFVCSYTGTLGMACGLQVVIEAAQDLRARGVQDIVFMLIGDGAIREELEAKARSLALDNVIFTHRQPKIMMPELLAISDVCLVHLRANELFRSVMPSKIFEAAGMAKPIINGVPGFAAELVKRIGAGLNIEPERSDQLIEALISMRSDPLERRAYGLSGYKHVTKEFDRGNLSNSLMSILQSVSRVAS